MRRKTKRQHARAGRIHHLALTGDEVSLLISGLTTELVVEPTFRIRYADALIARFQALLARLRAENHQTTLDKKLRELELKLSRRRDR